MRAWMSGICLAAMQAAFACSALAAETCADPSAALGVSRVVNIDTSAGPLYGDMSKFVREETFLGPKEVVLTFDDGPLPWITKSILDTLDKFCTKATFFSVGQMALAYPEYSKEVLARGHTLGAHTWSHPMNIGRLNYEKAKDQIERGFAAVALAAGQPVAPFFRFPGLNDSDPLLQYLQTRGIATFTVDVVSNDSYIASPARLLQRTIAQVEQRKGGILLFHDIKASTAHALPDILKELKAQGYTVVHMTAKAPLVPVASYQAELAPILARAAAKTVDASKAGGVVHQLTPFYGSASLLHPQGAGMNVPVTELTAPARARAAYADHNAAKARKGKRLATVDQQDTDAADQAEKPVRQKVRYKPSKKPAGPQTQPGIFPF